MKFLRLYQEKIIGGIMVVLASVALLVWGQVFTLSGKADLAIYFFDVGQGDASFIESRDGTQILIDGGPPNQILYNLSRVMNFADHHIDVLVLSHPHADHVSGLIEVLKNFDVDYVAWSAPAYHTPEAKEFEKLLKEKISTGELQEIIIDRPLRLIFFDGAQLDFLHPDRSYEDRVLKQVHDSMVVTEFSYKNRKFLFMGDAEKDVEAKLVREELVGDVDVLKVGHQGSKTSSSQYFLDAITPEYAVIPVGKNSYGHPNQDVVQRLAAATPNLFRTDEDGTIMFTIDQFGNLILQQ